MPVIMAVMAAMAKTVITTSGKLNDLFIIAWFFATNARSC